MLGCETNVSAPASITLNGISSAQAAAIAAETVRAQYAESGLNSNIVSETSRAKAAEAVVAAVAAAAAVAV